MGRRLVLRLQFPEGRRRARQDVILGFLTHKGFPLRLLVDEFLFQDPPLALARLGRRSVSILIFFFSFSF